MKIINQQNNKIKFYVESSCRLVFYCFIVWISKSMRKCYNGMLFTKQKMIQITQLSTIMVLLWSSGFYCYCFVFDKRCIRLVFSFLFLNIYWLLVTTFAVLIPARRFGRFAPLSFALCICILGRFAPSGFVLHTRFNERRSIITIIKKILKKSPVKAIEPACRILIRSVVQRLNHSATGKAL